MNYSKFFKKLIVKRDFKPVKGQMGGFEHFFQCHLPLYGSMFLLFVLCSAGLFSIVYYIETKQHVETLKDDPFVSAIRVEDASERKEFDQLKTTLFYDENRNRFIRTEPNENPERHKQIQKQAQNNTHIIPVVKAVLPYKRTGLLFFEKNVNEKPDYRFGVITLPVLDQSSDTKAGQINKWIQKQLIYNNNLYFNIHNYKTGIIISNACLKRLKYEGLPENIRFLYRETPLLKSRKKRGIYHSSKLSSDEKYEFTMEIPVVNIAKSLPGEDAIVSEQCYELVIKKNLLNSSLPANSLWIKYNSDNRQVIEKHIIPQIMQKYDAKESTHDAQNKRLIIRFKIDGSPSIFALNKYIDQLKKAQNIFFETTTHRVLPAIESPLKAPDSRVSGAFVFLNNHSGILKRTDQLIRILKEDKKMLVDSHQMMTLKKYQNDLYTFFKSAIYFGLCIGGIIFLFIFITFNLLLQTKMHDIGMMKAMGATSSVIRKIYKLEAFYMIFYPLCLSIFTIFCYNFFVPAFQLSIDLILYILIFSISIILCALWGAKIAVRHVVAQAPCKLISYRT